MLSADPQKSEKNTFTIVSYSEASNPFYSLCVGRLPKCEKDSISSVAKKKKISKLFITQPVYSHWFDVAIYNLRGDLQQQLKDEKMKLLTGNFLGFPYQIDTVELDKCSAVIMHVGRPEEYTTMLHRFHKDSNLRDSEVT